MADDGSLREFFELLIKEGKRRLLPLTILFAVVALLSLAVGLLMPKRWDAATLIIVEVDNVIKPLMEGRAVSAPVTAQTALVSQVVLGHKILRKLAVEAGIMPTRISPQDQEQLLNQFRSRIKIDNKNDEIIRIAYSDTDPKRAARITNLIGKTFIDESNTLKAGESREAFEFIDKRVKEYGQKLTEAHQKLLDYYRGVSTRPALGARVAGVAGAPGAETPPLVAAAGRLTPDQLASLRIEAATLEAQLGRKSQAAIAQDNRNEEQARARVTQAQADLDKLVGTFTDEHPDVRRARRELASAKDDLRRSEQARADLDKARAAAAALDDEVAQAARARLEQVQQKIAAATGRRLRAPVAARGVVEETDKDPEMKGVGQDTTQSALFRIYDSTREVYEDLLKRRENARVSMDLDAEHRGLTMRVQEEAEVPATASSLRLLHLSIIGLVLALAVPFGLLFAIVRFDRRVRSPQQIERLANVPLLVSIPYEGSRHRSLTRRRDLQVALLVCGVFLVYGATFVIKMMSS
jgi:polysaccharide chain length determinant protein (PEP-CTERM system associated)